MRQQPNKHPRGDILVLGRRNPEKRSDKKSDTEQQDDEALPPPEPGKCTAVEYPALLPSLPVHPRPPKLRRSSFPLADIITGAIGRLEPATLEQSSAGDWIVGSADLPDLPVRKY